MTKLEKTIRELSQLYDFYQKIKKRRRGFVQAPIENQPAQPMQVPETEIPHNPKSANQQ